MTKLRMPTPTLLVARLRCFSHSALPASQMRGDAVMPAVGQEVDDAGSPIARSIRYADRQHKTVPAIFRNFRLDTIQASEYTACCIHKLSGSRPFAEIAQTKARRGTPGSTTGRG